MKIIAQKIKALLDAFDNKFLWRVMVFGLQKRGPRKVISCTGFKQYTREPINPKGD